MSALSILCLSIIGAAIITGIVFVIAEKKRAALGDTEL